MEFKDLFEVIKELIGIPYYYTERERSISISLSVIAGIIGFFVLRRLVPQTKRNTIITSVLFVLSSLFYAYLFEMGGVYFLQTMCRVLILLTICFLIPYDNDKAV
jgi:hypothetical protein